MSRKRYRFNEETHSLEEVPNDYTGAERRAQTATEELTYGGLRATDGTPINTKRRHREYMQATGTTLASDFTGTWKQAEKDRASPSAKDRASIRETVGRALYENRRRK